MRVDLHLHSHVSDGDLSPTALVHAASEAALDVIALTDHDTAEGVSEALSAAADLPISVIPGIEISTRSDPHEFHILGYWIDPDAPSMRNHAQGAATRRLQRMEKMVERLRALGVPITMEEVHTAAGPDVRTLGRPHLARALLAGGFIRAFNEAFLRFIGDGGPAFVEQDFPSPRAAIEAIHQAGGVAVWAHPPLHLVEDLLPAFVEWGLDGVECNRPNLTPGEIEHLRALASHAQLLVTGGSDWHGPRRNFELGTFWLRPEQVSQLLAVGGIVAAS